MQIRIRSKSLYNNVHEFMHKERTSAIKLKTYHYIILAFLLTMFGCNEPKDMEISQSPVIQENWLTFINRNSIPPMPLSNIEDKNLYIRTITDDINNYSFSDIEMKLLQWSLQNKSTKSIENRMQQVDMLYTLTDLLYELKMERKREND